VSPLLNLFISRNYKKSAFLAFVKKNKNRFKAIQLNERNRGVRSDDAYADDDLYPFDDPNNQLLDHIRFVLFISSLFNLF
jgi:hypothetical protein